MCALVEVFSVSYVDEDGSGTPSGTISVYDGKRGQVIYRRGHGHTAVSSQKKQKRDNDVMELLLTGPYRAISADGCVAIVINLRHGCKNGPSSYEAEILIDMYDDATQYDVAITKEVKTCTCIHSPRVEVQYAILSDAVEANVEVKLIRRTDCPVKIVAHYVRGDADRPVVLFESNDKTNMSSSSSKEPTTILLTRSVLAVPLEWSLNIEVDLQIRSSGENVKDFVVCKPNLDCPCTYVGQNVEVKIAC